MAATGTRHAMLQGCHVLVVEDEYLIAEEIAEVLSDAGARTLGPIPSIVAAMALIATDGRIDAALLDVNVGSRPIWPVVDALLARRVPLVLSTGYDTSAIPQAYVHLPRCEKPASGRDIVRALAEVLASRSPAAD